MEIKEIKIADLKPYKDNAKKHPQKQIDLLKSNILKFGFTTPVLIDKDNTIIAGHGRLLAMKSLGKETVPCVVMGTLTEEEVKALRLADNRIAEMGEWDMDLVIAELKDISAPLLDLTGFSSDLIITPEEADDEVPEVPQEPQSVLGDLYELGGHRVLCGDSAKLEDVQKLMDGKKSDMVFTDPPYGINYQSNMRTKSEKFKELKNDDQILTDWIPLAWMFTKGFIFIWTTWKVLPQWIEETKILSNMSNMVIWHKGGGGIGDLKKTFSTDYEIALVFNNGFSLKGKRIGSVWSVGKDGAASYQHPTQKPVELAVRALVSVTEEKESVLDLFLGSGSTLIAAQKTKRICYGMELDPKYVDVIVSRYCKYANVTSIKKNGEEIEWVTK